MGSAADVLKAAASQVGYNGDGTCDNPITKFGEWAGVQTQWCAEFCSWALDQGGVASEDRFGRFPYGDDNCADWAAKLQQNHRWHDDPAPGDLVFYSWQGDGVAEHIGLVESVEPGGSIVTIEGNTDDPEVAAYNCGNCCRRKHRDTRYVLGYGRPKYTDEASAEATAATAAATLVRPGMYELIRNEQGRVIAAGPGFWCDTNRADPQQTIDAISQLKRSALCINQTPRDVRDAEMILLHDLWIVHKES